MVLKYPIGLKIYCLNFSLKTKAQISRLIDTAAMLLFVLRYWLRKKPYRNVPLILPAVEIAKNFPDILPDSSIVFIANLIAYGVIIPIDVHAGAKRIISIRIEPSL